MEGGKSFDDHGGGRCHGTGFRGRVTKMVLQFGGLALMFCFSFVNVHREHQRSTTSKRGYREENKLTENQSKMGTFVWTQ